MPLFYIILFIRFGLAGVWSVSGLSKLVAIDAFRENVRAYSFPILSGSPFDSWIGIGLPIVELVVGVLLLIGYLKRSSYVVSLILFSGFIIAVGYAIQQGIEIPCGCFGVSSRPISIWHLLGLIVGLGLIVIQLIIDEDKAKSKWISEGCQ